VFDHHRKPQGEPADEFELHASVDAPAGIIELD